MAKSFDHSPTICFTCQQAGRGRRNAETSFLAANLLHRPDEPAGVALESLASLQFAHLLPHAVWCRITRSTETSSAGAINKDGDRKCQSYPVVKCSPAWEPVWASLVWPES